ncbi:MAG: type 4a pilus biogenesis protein PilO [Gammaproteobacteria bacterium]|nr:type 4a pilus biogenesis protein PilO [Gammaproteobacteria bacterium]
MLNFKFRPNWLHLNLSYQALRWKLLTLPRWGWYLGLTLTLTSFSLLCMLTGWQNAKTRWQLANAQETQLKTTYQKYYQRKQNQTQLLKLMTNTSQTQQLILTSLLHAARHADLRINQFKPKAKANCQSFCQQEFNISLTGDYASLMTWLNNMQNLKQPNWLLNLNLRATNNDQLTLSASFIVAYRQNKLSS